MDIKQITTVESGQDGAIYKNLLFRFGSRGKCRVYDLSTECDDPMTVRECMAEFMLDRAEEIAPHSNAVFFGTEKYCEDDELPLLYSNIYNNYAKCPERRVGMLCVYRIERCEGGFKSTLVQLIEIGFKDERGLWLSEGDTEDVRPFGNFVMDKDEGKLYAFVMRDGDKSTRYFAFDMPKLTDGEIDRELNVRKVTLAQTDIKEYFDTPYHRYVQGACMRAGLIYSTEGFGKSIHPAIRVIDTAKREQVFFLDFFEAGYEHEAEFIDFYGDRCLYSDAKGNVFELTLD